MFKFIKKFLIILLLMSFIPTNNVWADSTDYYYPDLQDIYFANNQEMTYGDTMSVYAMVDNQGYEVSKITLQMKSTSSMATFTIDLSYDSSINRWVGQRKIDEPTWLGSSWIANYIILEDNNGHTKYYSQHDRYYIDEYFGWEKLSITINPPADSSFVLEKTYQGTEWKNRVVDLTSDFTNTGTLIIENSTIKANGFKFTNKGRVILKGKNTIYVKDGYDGFWDYGELILKGSYFHEIGTEVAAMPKVNRVTNTSDAITGYGEIGAVITVYNNNRTKVYGTGIVGEDMRFSIPLAEKLKGGTFGGSLYITMKGHAPKGGSTYTEVWDVIPPSQPELYKVNELTTKIKGTTDESSTIFIKRDYNSKPIAQGHTDDQLHFSIDIPRQEIGDTLIVYAVDYDGNESELSRVTVKEKGAPTELSGTYSDGILYAENGPYLVNGKVNLTNQMFTIEPGVEFIAKSNTNPSINIDDFVFAEGRADAPITFNEVPVLGVEGYFKNVKFINLNINKKMAYMQMQVMRIYDSQVINSSFEMASGEIQRSLFLNSPISFSKFYLGYAVGYWGISSIRNNTFVMDSQSYEWAGKYYQPPLTISGYEERSIPSYAIKNNSFITPDSVENIISFTGREAYKLDLTNNYWGTTDLNSIKTVKLGEDPNILFDPILQEKPADNISYSFPAVPTVETINKDERIVRGKASPGNTVKIIMDKFYYYTVPVGADGSFSYLIPNKMTTDTKIQVFQLDENGIGGSYASGKVVDITAPSEPTVSGVSEFSETVTGVAEAYSKIKVYVNGSVIATGTATNTGSFSVNIPKQKAGTFLEVKATDNSGNVSKATQIVVKDLTPPVKPVINNVTDKDSMVKGQAEVGASIQVQIDGRVVGTGTVGTDGNFTVEIPVQKAGIELSVIASDKDGNSSEPATVVVKDATPPDKPVVFPVSEMESYLSGYAEEETTIELLLNGEVIGTGVTDKYGYFYIVNFPAQEAGTQLVVIAKDEAGNVSDPVTISVKDITPPEKPVVNGVTDQDTVVTGRAEAGSNVEVESNGSVIGTGTAGEDGHYEVTIPVQQAGNELVFTATDKAGNVSEETTVVVKDATAPVKPVLSPVSDKDTIVSGQAEAGSKIEVKVNGSVIGTGTAGQDGKYKVTIRVQKAGTVLVIIATDASGNESEAATIKVIDKTAPSVLTLNTVSDKSKEVTGKTEDGATISILIGTKIYIAKADINGNFKVIIPILKAGTKLIVTAKDVAGNVSVSKSITVLDKTVPVTPVVSTVSNLTKVVTGKAEAGSIVTVNIGTKKYIAKADVKGNYKVTIPVQKAGTKVIVTAKDAAGNVSAAKSVIVMDKSAPTAPKIKTAVKSTTKEVTGTAEAYSTITIKVGKKVIGTAKTDSKGKFKVKIKAQRKKTVLSVTATDKAKNVSKAATVKVK